MIARRKLMASSQYKFLVSVGGPEMDRLGVKTIQDALESPETISLAYDDELNLNERFTGFILGRDTHSCRETLISYANRVVTRIMWGRQLTKKVLTFLYLKENGVELSKIRTDKIMAIAGKINYPGYITIAEIVYCGNPVIAITMPCTQAKNMYLASLLLWIFRKEEIMNWIIEHIRECTSIISLLRVLSRQFILHPEWGDNANNPILMSIFCYTFTENTISTINHNGPVRLAGGLSTYLVSQYFQKLYCPMLMEFNGVLPEKSRISSWVDLKHLLVFEKAFYKKPRKKAVKPVVIETTQESEA
jgi:hypothetical protein